MFQTVSGSLHQALEIAAGEVLLIRGGSSSIGMLACQLAKAEGLTVVATTRDPGKRPALLDNGADHVLIDGGSVEAQLREHFPNGAHKVLELVGTKTLKDSLRCLAHRGTCCMTGILGDEWTMADFTPMGDIPSLGRLTVYMGEADNISQPLLQAFIDHVAAGEVRLNVDRVFSLDEVAAAHAYMEANRATGKVVVVI